jgi:hypothetical protein
MYACLYVEREREREREREERGMNGRSITVTHDKPIYI